MDLFGRKRIKQLEDLIVKRTMEIDDLKRKRFLLQNHILKLEAENALFKQQIQNTVAENNTELITTQENVIPICFGGYSSGLARCHVCSK